MPIRPAILLALALSLAAAPGCAPRRPTVSVFYAAAFEPVLHVLLPQAEREQDCVIASETGGSGNLMRKVTELGRDCDLMLLADGAYFKTRGNGRFSWRLEFMADELVLAVGQRAPRPDAAERDWVPVLLDPAVRLGRADETISPAGVRTRRVWQIREQAGSPGLEAALLARTALVADDVGTLSARLKAGDIDYAFLYRTTCLMQDIRYIRLTQEQDPIRYALSIPANAIHREKAEALVGRLLNNRTLWEEKGFLPIPPRFYGEREALERLPAGIEYGGPF